MIRDNTEKDEQQTVTACLPVAGVHVGGGELLEHGAAVDVSLAVQHGVARPVLHIEDHPDLVWGTMKTEE